MVRKIVLATDTSEQAAKAFDWALEAAQVYRAELVVLAVARPPEPAEVVETAAVLESATGHYQKHFSELREKASAAAVTARFEIRVGHPAEQIIHFAMQERADAIVMGHRGKTFVERWLLGSVSKRVLSYAHCTVVIVR
jgi:nucleotide-binding universal stress UspA family protein